jgi:hypothetical protein
VHTGRLSEVFSDSDVRAFRRRPKYGRRQDLLPSEQLPLDPTEQRGLGWYKKEGWCLLNIVSDKMINHKDALICPIRNFRTRSCFTLHKLLLQPTELAIGFVGSDEIGWVRESVSCFVLFLQTIRCSFGWCGALACLK